MTCPQCGGYGGRWLPWTPNPTWESCARCGGSGRLFPSMAHVPGRGRARPVIGEGFKSPGETQAERKEYVRAIRRDYVRRKGKQAAGAAIAYAAYKAWRNGRRDQRA